MVAVQLFCKCVVLCCWTLIYYKNITFGDEHNWIMAARMGIGAFSGEPTEWEDYVDRLENYFVAHDVKEDVKKRAILLSESAWSSYVQADSQFSGT